jgi:hypothetical protein
MEKINNFNLTITKLKKFKFHKYLFHVSKIFVQLFVPFPPLKKLSVDVAANCLFKAGASIKKFNSFTSG